MKKFDKYNILNEGQPAPGNEVSSEFEAAAKEAYAQSRKLDNLNVVIKLPTSFKDGINFPLAPIDLRNLLKPEKFAAKFVNGHGMMADPVSTFNAAADLAKQCFEHANNFKAPERPSDHKITADNSKDSSAYSLKHESLYYFNGNYLNEDAIGAATTGAKIGATVGKVATAGGSGILGFGAGFLATTAGLATACYSLGYAGERAFGNVAGTHTIATTNTQDVINSNEKTKQDLSDASWLGENVIEAVDSYLRELSTQIDGLLAFLNPDAKADFAQAINNFIVSDTKGLENWLHDNSGLMKQINDEADAKLNKIRERRNTRAEHYEEFTKSLSQIKDTDLQIKLLNVYNNGNASTQNAIISAMYDDDIAKLKSITADKNVSASIQYNYSSALNEAEDSELNKLPEVDGNQLYNDYLTKFQDLARESWPKKINTESCKTNMDKLKAGCDKEIKDKIDIICRTTNDGTATTTSDKIKSFFSKHPLQSKYLINLWERHATDLNMREENRLQQMQDISDTTRVLGWFAYIFKHTLPEVLARIFTYRHVLMLLKQQGLYTYTPEMFKEDEEEFEKNKVAIMNDARFKTLVYFNAYGQNWTESGKNFIVANENGGYSIDSENYPAYLSFLLMNISGNKRMTIKFANAARELAENIANKNLTDANKFVEYFLGAINDYKISQTLIDGVGAQNEEAVKTAFTDTTTLAKNRQDVDDAFNKINGIDCEDATTSLSYAVLKKLATTNTKFEDYANIINAFDNLKAIHDEYYTNGKLKEDANKKELENAIKKALPNVTLPKVEPNFELEKYKTAFAKMQYADKLGYVYQIHDALGVKNYFEGKKDSTIADKCKNTAKFVELITSGVLVMGSEIDQSEIQLNAVKEAYKKLIDNNSALNLDNLYSIIESDQQKLADFKSKTNDMDPAIVKQVVDKITKYITSNNYTDIKQYSPDGNSHPFESITDSFSSDKIDGAKNLSEFLDGDSKVTVSGDDDNAKTANIKESIYTPLAMIIEYAIAVGNAYSAETLTEYIKNSGVSSKIKFIADNYNLWKQDIDSSDPADQFVINSKTLIDKMKNDFIDGYNKIMIEPIKKDELKLDANSDVWQLIDSLSQTTNVKAINLNGATFNGQAFDKVNDKYELLTYLYKYINDNLFEYASWKNFLDQFGPIK